MALDTEDDGHGNVSLVCVVHEKGSYYHRDRDKVLEWLLLFSERIWSNGGRVVCWCTNLEYDLVNLFGSRLKELAFRFGRSQLVSAKWRHMDFRDTVRHVPASVKELGKLVGLPKLKMDDSIRYCMRDARITYRAAAWIENVYKEFDVEPKSTLPATAYRIWASRFWKQDVRLPSEAVWMDGAEAYYGGHTEAFYVGTFEKVKVIDAASMFPWAMTAGDFPIPWGLTAEWRKGEDIEPNGIYQAFVECVSPCLPVRTDRGLAYPVGQFAGQWVGVELIGARRLGARVDPLRGIHFLENGDPFTGYIRALYALKARARGLPRSVYKLMLNGLYGKFGQRGIVTRLVALEKLSEMEFPPDDFLVWNGLAIFTEERAPPPWGNNVWAAIITARARVRLLEEMRALEQSGAQVLYCDTDSVFFTGGTRRYPVQAQGPGEFELRGEYRRAIIVGKKEYGLQDRKGKWKLYAKGIPPAVRQSFLENGSADFVRPVRFREAARRGLVPNDWRTFRKVRRTDLREDAGPGGKLVPLTLNERG